MKIVELLFIIGFFLFRNSGENMTNTVSAKNNNNEKCEVSFFKRWTGYSHPVRVIDPINFSDALMRGNYQRAWICEKNSKELFVLLERVEAQGLNNINIKNDTDLSFFLADVAVDGAYKLGREITIAETFYLASFYVEATEASGHVGKFLIKQKLGGKFEYMYDSMGKLAKLRVTNDEGTITELDY